MSGRYQKQSPKKGKKIAKTILLVILLLLLAAVIGGILYFNSMLGKVNHVSVPEIVYTRPDEESMETLPTEAEETTETTVPEAPTQPHIPSSEDYLNVLIVGQAGRSGEPERFADTSILCTLNTYEKTLTLTSLLRDSFVKMPDYKGHTGGRIKLTTIYHLGSRFGDGVAGSMELMNMTLFNNFGIEVDENIEVDFDAFERVVDTLGGIDIELTEAEAAYMNDDGFMGGYHFEPGPAHLDGLATLVYARMRKAAGDNDSDIARTVRQRQVMDTLLTKLKTLELSQVQALANDVLPMVSTSMTKSEITNYMLQLLPILPDLTIINNGNCPAVSRGDLVDIYGDGMMHSVLRFDQAQTIKTMRQITEGEMP